MSRNITTAPSLYTWSIHHEVTITEFGTSMASTPGIDMDSLCISKRDLRATFADLLEPIITNLLNGLSTDHRAQSREQIARISSAVPGLPWSSTPSRGWGTLTGIDPSPISRKIISRLDSVGKCCATVSGEEPYRQDASHIVQVRLRPFVNRNISIFSNGRRIS
ncbi:hypothetical protein PoB_004424300 [Plakobranchus ocellatus]|uniref:Uncharacterized protein n=1 Tax=Plakobranchus ocellatus TaxID=259542 RepID=A0AAV4BDU4_9GAST|nr:hypothetical protein PoB_004424300 [Plakobranchus ocellatus]